MPDEMPAGTLRREWLKCADSPAYFAMHVESH